jgi:hypothetical protein
MCASLLLLGERPMRTLSATSDGAPLRPLEHDAAPQQRECIVSDAQWRHSLNCPQLPRIREGLECCERALRR